jgi:hypothetical protein
MARRVFAGTPVPKQPAASARALTRSERRASQLAERRKRKKEGPPASGTSPAEHYAWMAGLLPMGGGRVLEVAAEARGTAALEVRGWQVVAVEPGAVLAPGNFAGERVDAVTCWLLDLRAARPAGAEKLRAMGLRTPEENRLAVLTLVYRLADRVLRPQGLLQVVERTREPFGESLAAGMVRLQRAQSQGTTLEFASLDARPEGAGALVSVLSRKAV